VSGLGPVAGLAALLGAGAAVAGGLYLAGLWRDVTRPPRRALGWALGQGLAASPSDLGLDFTERTVELADARMPCWWIAGRGDDPREVVILLHGHGRSRWDSLRRVAPWAERAALLVLPDLRGHGEAPGRSSLARREAGDVAVLAAEVLRERPEARITLAGHSLGAVVAIHAAARCEADGVPVARVVAWGPYDRVRTPFEARLRLRGLPVRPFSDAVLWLIDRADGPERATHESAALLRRTELRVTADATDSVSPVADAEAITAACPGARLDVSAGVAHADLGTG
jgi:pimeloyl-ACP methyl ester carboxylesterase